MVQGVKSKLMSLPDNLMSFTAKLMSLLIEFSTCWKSSVYQKRYCGFESGLRRNFLIIESKMKK
jgi:hypothetical protein